MVPPGVAFILEPYPTDEDAPCYERSLDIKTKGMETQPINGPLKGDKADLKESLAT